jgi:hypothetical protein
MLMITSDYEIKRHASFMFSINVSYFLECIIEEMECFFFFYNLTRTAEYLLDHSGYKWPTIMSSLSNILFIKIINMGRVIALLVSKRVTRL